MDSYSLAEDGQTEAGKGLKFLPAGPVFSRLEFELDFAKRRA